MARANKQVTELRARLETVLAEVAVIRRVMPVHRLRIHQVKERTGWNGLLDPALEEVDTINAGIDEVSAQVHAVLQSLGTE